MTAIEPLLEVTDLAVDYRVRGAGILARRRRVRAVDGVSFAVAPGETLALVGESGSGKTTTGRAALRLIEPAAGRALYRPSPLFPAVDLFRLGSRELRRVRRALQIVFQDPWASLNPRFPVREIVGEALRVHGIARGATELERRVENLLARVGLSAETAARFPFELSGGMRQRVGIARALALEPRFLVCDEPISALDVSLQAQILNLFADLKRDLGIAYLFIAHDLAVVRHLADRVAVMYAGRIVEQGTTDEIFESAAHPYTRSLLDAIPRLEPELGRARAGARLETRVPHGATPAPTHVIRLSATHTVAGPLADHRER